MTGERVSPPKRLTPRRDDAAITDPKRTFTYLIIQNIACSVRRRIQTLQECYVDFDAYDIMFLGWLLGRSVKNVYLCVRFWR